MVIFRVCVGFIICDSYHVDNKLCIIRITDVSVCFIEDSISIE